MPLLEGAQHDWLITTQGKDPKRSGDAADDAQRDQWAAENAALEDSLVDMMKDGDQRVARAEKLDEVNARIDDLREKLREASENLKLMVTTEDTPEAYEDDDKGNKKRQGAWEKSKQAMDWLAKDQTSKTGKVTEDHRDIEADTVHDLRGGRFHVKDDEDGAKVAEVMELHRQLIKIQTEMENATGPDGAPLFTAQDIERELWSPLIRADVIPSNAVADKYSQEAQVWNGACEMYQKRLDKFTSAKGSKHEKTLRGLRIAGDTVMLAGTLVGESLTAGYSFHGDGAVMTQGDTREFTNLAAQNKQTPLTGADLTRFDELSGKVEQGKRMKHAIAITQLSANVINGGLKTGEAVIQAKRAEEGEGTIIAEQVLKQLETITASAVSVAENNFKVNNPTLASSPEHKTLFVRIKAFTTAGFKISQVGVSIAAACEASGEGNIKKAVVAAINGVISSVCKTISGLGTAGESNVDFAASAARAEAALKSQSPREQRFRHYI